MNMVGWGLVTLQDFSTVNFWRQLFSVTDHNVLYSQSPMQCLYIYVLYFLILVYARNVFL